ncbi:MAG: J domain-containing protein [Bernardetiaceae bacterium]
MLFNRLKNIGRSYVNDWFKEENNDLDAEIEKILRQQEREDTHTQAPPPREPAFNPKENEYYRLLELAPNASMEEIKAAYRKMMKKYHPDRFPNDPTRQKAAVELTQKINVAYSYFKKKHESKN